MSPLELLLVYAGVALAVGGAIAVIVLVALTYAAGGVTPEQRRRIRAARREWSR